MSVISLYLLSVLNLIKVQATESSSTETSSEQNSTSSVAEHFLTLQAFNVEQFMISGQTTPLANIKIALTIDGNQRVFEQSADVSGQFIFSKEQIWGPSAMVNLDNLSVITVTSTSTINQEVIEQTLYQVNTDSKVDNINWTQIIANQTNVEFSKANVGDIFISGYGPGYIIEAVMSDNNSYPAVFDEMGNFYIELPWNLSNGEVFQINIYDANKVLIENIPVTVQESVPDTEKPIKPKIEQLLTEGQVIISGFGEPSSLILVRSTTKNPIIIPTDYTGYFFLELTKPIEVEEVVSIFGVDLANNISDEGIVEEIVANEARPAAPFVESNQSDSMNLVGEATPNSLIVVKRLNGDNVNYLQTESDNQGIFSVKFTSPLTSGEKVVFYTAILHAYNNIILSYPTIIEIQ